MLYSQLVRKVQNRFRFVIWGRIVLCVLSILTFLIGATAIGLRLYGFSLCDRFNLMVYGGAYSFGLVLILAVFYWLARFFVPNQTEIRAWLDNRFSCGGVLSAEEYFPDAHQWEDSKTAEHISSQINSFISVRATKLILVTVLSWIFLIGAILIPIPKSNALVQTGNAHLEKDVERIEQKIDLLEEEKLLSDKQAEQLRQKLQELSQNTDATDPLHTFEALDAMEDSLDQTAQQSAQQVEENSQSAQDAQDLADAMKKDWDKLSEAQKKATSEKLQSLLDNLKGEQKTGADSKDTDFQSEDETKTDSMNQDNSTQPQSIPFPEGMELPDMSQITPQQLEQLQEQLENYQGDLQELLENLQNGEFGDMEQFQIQPCDGESDSEFLQAFLDENCPDGSPEDCQQALEQFLQSQRGGRGGASRGDALPSPLQFDDNPPPDFPEVNKFKAEKLPTHLTRQAIEQSQLKGVALDESSQQSQHVDDVQGKVIEVSDSADGMGRTQNVYPMHRRSVQQYFNSGSAEVRHARRDE